MSHRAPMLRLLCQGQPRVYMMCYCCYRRPCSAAGLVLLLYMLLLLLLCLRYVRGAEPSEQRCYESQPLLVVCLRFLTNEISTSPVSRLTLCRPLGRGLVPAYFPYDTCLYAVILLLLLTTNVIAGAFYCRQTRSTATQPTIFIICIRSTRYIVRMPSVSYVVLRRVLLAAMRTRMRQMAIYISLSGVCSVVSLHSLFLYAPISRTVTLTASNCIPIRPQLLKTCPKPQAGISSPRRSPRRKYYWNYTS